MIDAAIAAMQEQPQQWLHWVEQAQVLLQQAITSVAKAREEPVNPAVKAAIDNDNRLAGAVLLYYLSNIDESVPGVGAGSRVTKAAEATRKERLAG